MQLALIEPDPEDALFRLLSELVDENGRKAVAAALGWEVSALSHALSRSTNGTKRRRYLPMDVLPALVRLRGGRRVVAWLCELVGGAFVERLPPTLEEQHAALVDAIKHELGPEMRKGLLRAAKEQIERRRGYYVGDGE